MIAEPTTIAVLCILFVASLCRFTLGFGDALVGMPLLLLFVSRELAVPLVALIILTVSGFVLFSEWRKIHVQSAWRLVIPGIAGIFLGLQFLQGAGERLLLGVLGAVIVGFAVFSLTEPKQLEIKNDNYALLFGFLAGALGGAYNTHAPPLVIYGTLRRWPAERFRATLQGYFFPASVIVVAGHGWAGRLSGNVMQLFFLSLPVMGLAWFCGHWLNKRIERQFYIRLVNWFLIAAGIALLTRAVF